MLQHVVLIWDLDETLIPFHSLLTGRWAAGHPGVDLQQAQQLGRGWVKLIMELADRHFGLEEVRGGDRGGRGRHNMQSSAGSILVGTQ
jgi:hypothetical protein